MVLLQKIGMVRSITALFVQAVEKKYGKAVSSKARDSREELTSQVIESVDSIRMMVS